MEVGKSQLALAEKILEEMIETEREGNENYELFVKHFDKETLNVNQGLGSQCRRADAS